MRSGVTRSSLPVTRPSSRVTRHCHSSLHFNDLVPPRPHADVPHRHPGQSFQAVENTYLATFQTLGGLGLLLGTFGLAVILVRNVLERVAELATLRALGYPRSALGWIVFTENALVLVVGLLLGTVAALVAVAPHLASGGALVPWLGLAATLLWIVLEPARMELVADWWATLTPGGLILTVLLVLGGLLLVAGLSSLGRRSDRRAG